MGAARTFGEVVFFGVVADDSDDAAVAPRKAARRSVLVRVPRAAASGRLALRRVDGTRSAASEEPLTIAPADTKLPAGVVDAEVRSTGLLRLAQAGLAVLRGRRVAPGRRAGGAHPGPRRRRRRELDRPGRRAGRAADGRVGRDGRRQGREAGSLPVPGHRDRRRGARRRRSRSRRPDRGRDARRVPLHQVPLPDHGRARLGEEGAAFGGGRGHQGHDVFAECGTPLVAARGGTVKFRQFQSRAGNYVVIDGARTGVDYAYMHLRDEALVDKGDKVATGQLLGYVGDTGRAFGCHLHFEQWSARAGTLAARRSIRCPTCSPGTRSLARSSSSDASSQAASSASRSARERRELGLELAQAHVVGGARRPSRSCSAASRSASCSSARSSARDLLARRPQRRRRRGGARRAPRRAARRRGGLGARGAARRTARCRRAGGAGRRRPTARRRRRRPARRSSGRG